MREGFILKGSIRRVLTFVPPFFLLFILFVYEIAYFHFFNVSIFGRLFDGLIFYCKIVFKILIPSANSGISNEVT